MEWKNENVERLTRGPGCFHNCHSRLCCSRDDNIYMPPESRVMRLRIPISVEVEREVGAASVEVKRMVRARVRVRPRREVLRK